MPDELMFPKRRMAKMTPVPTDENFEEQLVASLARITQGLSDIQETLGVLVAVLGMDDGETPPAPRRVVAESEHRPETVPHDPRD